MFPVTDLVIRPLRAGEHTLFLSMPEPPTVGTALLGRDFAETMAARQYRPEWTWVALDGGTVVARAAWWGGPDDRAPVALDWFDPGADPAVGARLLRAAGFTVDYHLMLPPGWREVPEAHRAAQLRITAAGAAGFVPVLERLRYRWTPADGLPERPARLTYEPVSDEAVLHDVLRRVLTGSLDFHQRQAIERAGVEAALADDLAFLDWLPSPREWWRLARDAAGNLAGVVVPGRNYASPIIAYVGVLPEARGHGYAFDLLVEGTHILVEQGAEAITADTDVTNTPMAATFARAGYPVSQRRLILSGSA
ncbi:GNAT family N-acetyltransferase [Dactylosporangium fulvum]|uniref:GNAT family N-acetyltransferase n=1 Tax=Dactylosporangium fulvum TaxID=53359 RepID=A0ABY5WCT6_9ACTN|nr:GNAT family N-acetyltransferase [Dactylosporangium fulvum]UWP86986.1 GNAT family N-acetyltransferase [Dactylosporangium fulvum]